MLKYGWRRVGTWTGVTVIGDGDGLGRSDGLVDHVWTSVATIFVNEIGDKGS